MNDLMPIEVDTRLLNERMASLHDALIGVGQAGDAANVIKDETRRLIQKIIQITPPKSKPEGEGAVRSDLYKLIGEAGQNFIDEIGSEFGTRNIDCWRTSNSGEKLHVLWERLDPTGDRMAEYHQDYRNKRGRVSKRSGNIAAGEWKKRVIVPRGKLAPYVKTVQARVGRRRASFGVTLAKLGGKVPSWISRHFGKMGGEAISMTEGLLNRERPSVIFGSRSPSIETQRSEVNNAVKIRAQQISRRVKLILSGYSRDLASGMKARARAGNYGGAE